MWQRIQTLYNLISSFCMLTALFVPVWSKKIETTSIKINYFWIVKHNSLNVIEKYSIFYVGLLALLASFLSLLSALKYTNRPFQLKIGLFNSFLLTLVLVLIAFSTSKGNKMLVSNDNGSFEIGFYLPGVALIFNWLANRAIKKDEKLVKDAFERLR
jgi:hypothetical protein